MVRIYDWYFVSICVYFVLGSNLLLQRLLIKKGIPDAGYQLISFDSDSNLCSVTYVRKTITLRLEYNPQKSSIIICKKECVGWHICNKKCHVMTETKPLKSSVIICQEELIESFLDFFALDKNVRLIGTASLYFVIFLSVFSSFRKVWLIEHR